MTSPSSPTNSLIAKLCAVMEAVDHVEKRGRNREQNYDFARDVDVSAALRKELAGRKVFLSTSITHIDTELYTTKSGGRGAISTVYTAHKFIDGETGETLDFTWASQGMDGQDKGVSKGATLAVKYALLKQFLIPTGDDPDEGGAQQQQRAAAAISHPPAPRGPQAAPAGSNGQRPTPASQGRQWQAEAIGNASEGARSYLRDWLAKHGYDEAAYRREIKERGLKGDTLIGVVVGTFPDLTGGGQPPAELAAYQPSQDDLAFYGSAEAAIEAHEREQQQAKQPALVGAE